MHRRLKVPHVGLEAAREAAKNKIKDISFEPKKTDLDEPKEGIHDPDEKPHSGGNRWAGGVSSSLYRAESPTNIDWLHRPEVEIPLVQGDEAGSRDCK